MDGVYSQPSEHLRDGAFLPLAVLGSVDGSTRRNTRQDRVRNAWGNHGRRFERLRGCRLVGGCRRWLWCHVGRLWCGLNISRLGRWFRCGLGRRRLHRCGLRLSRYGLYGCFAHSGLRCGFRCHGGGDG